MKCHGKLKQNTNKYFRCSVCVFPVSDLPIVLAGVSQGFVYIYKSLLKPIEPQNLGQGIIILILS